MLSRPGRVSIKSSPRIKYLPLYLGPELECRGRVHVTLTVLSLWGLISGLVDTASGMGFLTALVIVMMVAFLLFVVMAIS